MFGDINFQSVSYSLHKVPHALVLIMTKLGHQCDLLTLCFVDNISSTANAVVSVALRVGLMFGDSASVAACESARMGGYCLTMFRGYITLEEAYYGIDTADSTIRV